MLRKLLMVAMTGALLAQALLAGTFGKVVTIGGQANDLALDESRGVLYVANFTANRIDVMSLANSTVRTSINVPQQPNGISLSPDGHWLVVSHYGNNAAPAGQTNALTLIDLTAANARQTFSLGNPPLGVAFGLDNKALIVTTQEFLLFDPVIGSLQTITTISQVATNAIPQPPATFPPSFAQASVAVSRDGLTIAGFGGSSPYLLFRYNVATRAISGGFGTSSPAAGPRVVSLSNDGSLMSLAWWLADSNFVTVAEFANPSGLLNIGSTLIDSSRGLVYAQVPNPASGATGSLPVLQILDSDNLTLRETLQLPENLAGKSVLSSDNNTMYAISDSGVLILQVGKLNTVPRISASTEDLVFRGNFCDRSVTRQTVSINDPSGGNTPFTISSSIAGLTVTPSSGITPANVIVSVDPNAFASQKGTVVAALTVSSSTAVNLPQTIRVLINSQDPAQRGTFIDIPGKIVDVLADPKRGVYYLLRQDKNQVLIYNSSNNTLKSGTNTLRTCTTPTSMAITFDQQSLLVGCDHSQYMNVFDLDQLIQLSTVATPSAYVQSIAVSSNAILAMMRPGDSSSPHISNVDLLLHVATALPTLGVWKNAVLLDTVLASSSNGAHILLASQDGSVMIYDANVNSFTVSRKDFTSLAGAYAASSFDQYVVGNNLLNSSGVAIATLSTSGGSPSGFAFVDQTGYFTTAPGSASPGVIARVDLATGRSVQPTQMVEAPLLGSAAPPASGTNSCTTVSTATTTTQTCTIVNGTTITVTTQQCTTTTVGTTTTTACTNSSSAGQTAATHVFTRSLAPLPDKSEIINLTTSGFTVLPFTYASAVAPPQITKVVSAADGVSAVAPGGLISILGNQLAPSNLATKQIPLPTALASSCLTVNGQPVPIVFVSPSQINAQMPFQAIGDVVMIVHTPGGVSDNFNLIVAPNAPAVFLSGVAGPQTTLPTVIRGTNNLLVTDSNPVHLNDSLTIYLTGLGQTTPVVSNGDPSPGDPLAAALTLPSVTLGGQSLGLDYAGLAPGEVGVYQINVTVPKGTPTGLGMPLTVSQGGASITVNLRVVE